MERVKVAKLNPHVSCEMKDVSRLSAMNSACLTIGGNLLYIDENSNLIRQFKMLVYERDESLMNKRIDTMIDVF